MDYIKNLTLKDTKVRKADAMKVYINESKAPKKGLSKTFMKSIVKEYEEVRLKKIRKLLKRTQGKYLWWTNLGGQEEFLKDNIDFKSLTKTIEIHQDKKILEEE